MIKNTIEFHVDAKHFNYMWKDAMYITVQYTTWKEEGRIKFTIDNITAPPFLIGSIVLHGNWWAVDVEINAAVQANAEFEFAKQVHPTIASALAPFINH